jgi:excisionase family DNA binding protein
MENRMKLLTADEVAQILRLSTWQVYELARLGAIPHVRIRRLVRFRSDAIDEWTRNGGTPIVPLEQERQVG